MGKSGRSERESACGGGRGKEESRKMKIKTQKSGS